MTGRELAEILGRIHDAVLDGTYVLTIHALDEMKVDALNPIDVESALLNGTIRRVFEEDALDPRFEVVGKACDLDTDVGVVVRFAGSVLVITVYAMNLQ